MTILVEQAELDEKAAAMGITVTDAEITKRLDAIKKQTFGNSEKQMLAAAKKQGYDNEAAIRADVVRPQLISKRFSRR